MSLEANWFEEINEWEDLVLKEELTRGILNCRFLKPSGAQKVVVTWQLLCIMRNVACSEAND